ncbi:uncharacterized protein LOC120086960 [Benincasa hispida]|uniref:uncharacterized protein LOC120086960 n=1 Tax=Benincasa hispida TaxID=102211 RepID=UPI0019006CD2|nr:uncharacterized protein LOC120086960 [Benincasa hispida]XP_038899713.1 uncharacterized protein LOC120086960 [Benincasa hispida]XP_038899714.1 uncharacterized protein LOC120086960 [Benincasa hispida]XP_038899715.1 uncharacterized protein LOC120086960 [Benincasa hispida]XP_038899716.1 uncharacterized protein LOC120086960 [Benincasa hispida]
MVQKLQPTKGGGGSIKVGATGTISSLMMRELESMRSGPKKPVNSKNKSSSAASVPKRLQQSKSFEEVSNRSYNSVNSRSFGNSHNATKIGSRDVHRMPMLSSNDVYTDGNSYREKPERKGLRAVAIVDVKCNNPDRAWASRPLSSRLRKLGFSKLSETFA